MDASRPLDGRRVLITGGAGLLGVEHGVAVAAAGGVPVLADIDEAGLEQACVNIRSRTGSSAVAHVCDVTSKAQLVALRSLIERSIGPINALVNNAAINPTMAVLDGEPSGAFETYPLDAWNAELSVGLTGAMLCAQVFGAAMAEAGAGVIVNMASDLSVLAPDHRVYAASRRMEDVTQFKPVSYAVCKTALVGLTRYIATYWAHRGVRCNALAPGGVFNHQSDTLVEGVVDRTPMRRMARADEYHGALVFLLSDASAYMTGETLVIDGGRRIW